MNSTKSTASTLNSLIETLKDGQEGFRKASEEVNNSSLKTTFGTLSLQRSKFAGELTQLVLGLGEEEEKTSSVASALHRGWLNIRAALASGDEHSVLSECERGEDMAVAAYKKALEETLPANIEAVVRAQYDEVHAAHDQIRNLRDSTKKS